METYHFPWSAHEYFLLRFPQASGLYAVVAELLWMEVSLSPAEGLLSPLDPPQIPKTPTHAFLILWISSVIWLKVSGCSAICLVIFCTACMAVVWSRPPNTRAMSG